VLQPGRAKLRSPPRLSGPIMFIERHSAVLLHIAQSCINFEKLVRFLGHFLRVIFGDIFFELFALRPIFGNIFLKLFVLRPIFGPYLSWNAFCEHTSQVSERPKTVGSSKNLVHNGKVNHSLSFTSTPNSETALTCILLRIGCGSPYPVINSH
jgi:hypothetical protein